MNLYFQEDDYFSRLDHKIVLPFPSHDIGGNMKYKYALIFENGKDIKKLEKATKAILRNNYESVTWLEENDKRVKKLIKNGYWVYSIICIN